MAEVDARGKSCPLPIVLTAKAMRQLAIGENLIVRADDRAFLPDIEAWCRKTGQTLLSAVTKDGHYEATLQRAV